MAASAAWGVISLVGAPLAVRLGVGSRGFGALETIVAAGGLVGVLLTGRVLNRTGERRALVGAALVGALVLVAASFVSFGGVLMLLGVAGATRGLFDVTTRTALQLSVEDGVRARTLAAADAAAHVGFVIAFPVAAAVIERTGPSPALALAGAGASGYPR